MQVQRVASRHQGQVEFLGVDAEAVARAQANDVAALLEQLALVAQCADRLVARGLQARLDVVGLDAVLQFAKTFGQFAQLEDQRVGGEERVQFLRLGEARGASLQAVEDSPGGVEQSLGLALALVEQGLLVRLEGFQQLLALGQDVAEELLMVAELAFQFLQLHQQA